jgi:hypothetical protein
MIGIGDAGRDCGREKQKQLNEPVPKSVILEQALAGFRPTGASYDDKTAVL